MEDNSPIKNKVGAAPLPGSDRVWNRVKGAWENEYNQAPYIVWGWAAAVAKKSKNHDMAFDYLCFFANDANHQADIAIGRFGVNPFKKNLTLFQKSMSSDKVGTKRLPRNTPKRS